MHKQEVHKTASGCQTNIHCIFFCHLRFGPQKLRLPEPLKTALWHAAAAGNGIRLHDDLTNGRLVPITTFLASGLIILMVWLSLQVNIPQSRSHPKVETWPPWIKWHGTNCDEHNSDGFVWMKLKNLASYFVQRRQLIDFFMWVDGLKFYYMATGSQCDFTQIECHFQCHLYSTVCSDTVCRHINILLPMYYDMGIWHDSGDCFLFKECS